MPRESREGGKIVITYKRRGNPNSSATIVQVPLRIAFILAVYKLSYYTGKLVRYLGT